MELFIFFLHSSLTNTKLNIEKPVTQYEDVQSNNIKDIKEVYQRFENNINKREWGMNKKDNQNKKEKVKKRKLYHTILVSDSA